MFRGGRRRKGGLYTAKAGRRGRGNMKEEERREKRRE